jgi:aryl carrier-like protein
MATPLSETSSAHISNLSNISEEIRPAEQVDIMSRRIREVWGRVLGVNANQMSDNADFLRLGGSSLHAIKAVSAMRAQGLMVGTAQILGKATVRELAICCLSDSHAQTQVGESENGDPLPFSLL